MSRIASIEEVGRLAYRFRLAIEKAKEEEQFKETPFNRFPYGCCGDASDLLAQYLLDYGIKSEYVCRTYYKDEQSHSWIEFNGTIVDITADQFKGNKNYPQKYTIPCYVGKKNEFYELFEDIPNSRKRFLGIKNYDALASTRLLRLYETICNYIN